MKNFKWESKYLHWGMTAFSVIAASIVFYLMLNNLPMILRGLSAVVGVLTPFIWGLVFTYLLAPVVRRLEQYFLPRLAGKKKEPSERARKRARSVSVLLAELFLVVILAALVYLIIPQILESLQTIAANSQSYLNNLTLWLETVLVDYPDLENYLTNMFSSIGTNIVGWITNTVLPSVGSFVTNFTAGVVYVLKAVYNLVIGIIVSVYMLGSHERFAAGSKRLLYAVFSVETANRIRSVLSFTDKTFLGFINGKLVDSLIIGVICYICCAILRIPYALLVSVIVGVTNIIPFFGPLIGAVPSALLILMVNPMKCLIFVIFILVLQQVDGNFIGPKILGSSIGISGFWVMFSIMVGAGFFGFWGMLLGVPVFVVIYTGINKLIEQSLVRKELPTAHASYDTECYIDPESRSFVKERELKK